MSIAKEQIRQILSENNIYSVVDTCGKKEKCMRVIPCFSFRYGRCIIPNLIGISAFIPWFLEEWKDT